MTYPVTPYCLVCRYLNITIEYAYEFSDDGVISALALKLIDFVNVEKLQPVVIQVLYFFHQIDYPKQHNYIFFLALSKIQNKDDFFAYLQPKIQRKN